MKPKKSKTILFLALISTTTLFTVASTSTNAFYGYHKCYSCKHKRYSPVAICHIPATNAQVPPYRCCRSITNHGPYAFRHVWVSGSCFRADMAAMKDIGCTMRSPVYETGMPIMASCQFSAGTGYRYRY